MQLVSPQVTEQLSPTADKRHPRRSAVVVVGAGVVALAVKAVLAIVVTLGGAVVAGAVAATDVVAAGTVVSAGPLVARGPEVAACVVVSKSGVVVAGNVSFSTTGQLLSEPQQHNSWTESEESAASQTEGTAFW